MVRRKDSPKLPVPSPNASIRLAAGRPLRDVTANLYEHYTRSVDHFPRSQCEPAGAGSDGAAVATIADVLDFHLPQMVCDSPRTRANRALRTRFLVGWRPAGALSERREQP